MPLPMGRGMATGAQRISIHGWRAWGNRILGALTKPHAEDPIIFLRERRVKIKRADETPEGGDRLRRRSSGARVIPHRMHFTS